MMNGAQFEDVIFNRSARTGDMVYTIVLTDVDFKYIQYWNQYRPIGNIRYFSKTRLILKRKIHEKQIAQMSQDRVR